jgi:hypothetical protein
MGDIRYRLDDGCGLDRNTAASAWSLGHVSGFVVSALTECV